MRAKILVATVMLMAGAAQAHAESIEESEAKKRGVAVEVVQLENVRAVNLSLQKQLADLRTKETGVESALQAAQKELADTKAKLAALQDSMTPKDKARVASKQSKEAEIVTAIKEKRIVAGMTMEQVKKAISGVPQLENQTQDSTMYSTYIDSPDGALRVLFTIENGVVTDFSQSPVRSPSPTGSFHTGGR